jgi:hypothetical protein
MNRFTRHRSPRRVLRTAAAGLVVVAAGFTGAINGASAKSTGAPVAGGTIHLYDIASVSIPKRYVVITGAFADAGSIGSSSAAILKRGTITFDDSKAMAAEAKIFAHLSRYVNPRTCALDYTYSAPVTITGGTGAYHHISGTLITTTHDVGVLPRRPNGSCNESSNTTPYGFVAEDSGTGHVTLN